MVKDVSVVNNGLVGIEDPAKEITFCRISHLPGRPVQPGQSGGDGGDEHGPVAGRGGDVVMLDETAVGVVSVAGGHVGEHGAEGITREDEFRAVFHQATSHGDGAGFPYPVGLSHIRDGHLVVHRVHVVGELGGAELIVKEHADVCEPQRRTDLPVPPVEVLVGRGSVTVRIHPIQPADDIREEGGITLERASRRDIAVGHGTKARVAVGDMRRVGRARQIAPKESARRRFIHSGPEGVRRARNAAEPRRHVGVCWVVVGSD